VARWMAEGDFERGMMALGLLLDASDIEARRCEDVSGC
jgi:hypothetical protein